MAMLGAPSLRCHLGWHAPRSGGVWNHGYCFTACDRCGRDMVRSMFGEWHVPKGFRVVARGDAGAIADLDAVMTARDAAVAMPPPAPAPAGPLAATRIARAASAPSPRVARLPPTGSPFDFQDFDAIDPTTGVFVDAPTAPLSRAVP